MRRSTAVVTARGVDTGQLISEGSGSELFHMQALQTLRVYTNVPEVYTAAVKRGEKIPLTFPQYPGRTFEGTLVRTADAIDPANRTLLVEIDVDNRKGELMPGSLAQVEFKTPSVGQTFIVPASALIFRREGMRVGTVVERNGATNRPACAHHHRPGRRRHRAGHLRPQRERPRHPGSARLAHRWPKGPRRVAQRAERRIET